MKYADTGKPRYFTTLFDILEKLSENVRIIYCSIYPVTNPMLLNNVESVKFTVECCHLAICGYQCLASL